MEPFENTYYHNGSELVIGYSHKSGGYVTLDGEPVPKQDLLTLCFKLIEEQQRQFAILVYYLIVTKDAPENFVFADTFMNFINALSNSQSSKDWHQAFIQTAQDTTNLSSTTPIYYTYLMRDERTGLIKIGRSCNVRYREHTLQSEYPLITLIATTPNNIEKQLHDRFNNHRVRGEWFNLSDSCIKGVIAEYGFKVIKNPKTHDKIKKN